MNVFVAAVAELCAAHRLEEKRLIAPSRRVGNQWLDAAARAGRPALNVRVETMRSLAVELAAPELARAGLAIAPRRAEALLVDRLLRELPPGRLRYLHSAAPGPGLAAALLASLTDLRVQGVPEERLRAGVLDERDKAADLRLLSARYAALLAGEGLADYARVLRAAAERLAGDPEALGRDTLVIAPGDFAPNGLERLLLEAVPADRLRFLPVDPPGVPEQVRFACAVGEGSEVRASLRACLEQGVALDETELLYTDPAYVGLLVEASAALESPSSVPEAPSGEEPAFLRVGSLPLTFAEGLPCTLSRPGRALTGWLRWMSEGYPQSALVAMVREGQLEIDRGTEGENRTSFWRLAALLRAVPIGQERDRYLPRIDERLAAERERLAAAEASGADEPADEEGALAGDAPGRRDRCLRRLAELTLLRGLVERLVGLSPPAGSDGRALVSAADAFLSTCARSANRLDRFAAEKLGEELGEMAHWLGRAGGGNPADARAWIETLAADTMIGGSGPRPGCLHVAHLRSGGHSGRTNTFVVGLDDGRFPGAGLQDPLLLDHERARLDPGLPTAGRRLEEKVDGFALLLGRLRGIVTLCWPCRDVVEDRELFPSQVVLDAFRAARASPAADQRELLNAAGLPASFAPDAPERALDPGEWWLWRFTGDATVTNAREILERRAPHLVRGSAAAGERERAVFTAWDGRVPLAGRDLDPTAATGKLLSSNGLETAGACPRKFFYRYALDIAPPEELVVDPARWLDPLATGSLLHELFEQYVREIVRDGRPSDFDRGRSLILGMLERKLVEYRRRYPSPSLAAGASERVLLVLAAETFVREEERHALATGGEPVFLEASLGMPPGEHGTGLDHPDPIPVALPDGREIRVRGRVDRIDRLGGEGAAGSGWEIWDYKTGGTWGFERTDPFPEGRKIQPYLYLRMVERRLRASVDPGAVVRGFGYFFPGARGRGERIFWDAERLAAGAQVLAGLCRIVASGAFCATTDAGKDCRRCDYAPACGDVAAQAAATVRKVLAGDPLLGPLGRLREQSLAEAADRREDMA